MPLRRSSACSSTVSGVMVSFLHRQKARTTNLEVVAPGIAETLLATALGIVAAIPAQ
jgi:biopolymer transport protein ExbB